MRRCRLCRVEKPLDQFNTPVGSYCLECRAAMRKGKTTNMEPFKICSHCNQSRPTEDFETYGPKARCRQCRKEYQRKRQEDRDAYIKQLGEYQPAYTSSAADEIRKMCAICGEYKLMTAFRITRTDNHIKRAARCQDCERAASRQASALKREKARQERIEASLALSWEERVEQKRRKNLNSHYKAAYGKTIEEYEEMVRQQKGCCAICGRRPSEVGETLVVDHSHVTGAVRGLLCFWCNVGLGWFQDNITSLSQAAQYLKSYQVWEDQDYIENTLSRSSEALIEAS